MIVTRRGVVSVEDATAKLDALARRCGITAPRYDEAEADSMSEFDALEWICLCSQRVALQQREKENVDHDCSMPRIMRNFYMNKPSAVAKKLKNAEEDQLSIAA
jgi:hypothetical protein